MNYALSPPLLQKAQRAAGGTCFAGLSEFVYLLHLSFVKPYVDRINNTTNTACIWFASKKNTCL